MFVNLNQQQIQAHNSDLLASLPKVVIHIADDEQHHNFMLQPYAKTLALGKSYSVDGSDYEALVKATGVVFDRKNCTPDFTNPELIANYVERQALAHFRAYQLIANDPTIDADDFVLVIQDDLYLDKFFPQRLWGIINPLSNLSPEQAGGLDFSEISFISLEHYQLKDFTNKGVEALGDLPVKFATYVNLYEQNFLLRTLSINSTAHSCYLIRKRAILDSYLAQSKVANPAFDITSVIEFTTKSHCYVYPPLAINQVDHFSIDNDKNAIIKALNAEERRSLALHQGEGVLPEEDSKDNFLYDHLASVPKYVFYSEEEENLYSNFYNNPEVHDFIPLKLPNLNNLGQSYRQETYAYQAQNIRNSITFLENKKLALGFGLREAYLRVLADPNIAEYDFVVFANWQNDMHPSWRERLNHLITRTTIFHKDSLTKVFCLGVDQLSYQDYPLKTLDRVRLFPDEEGKVALPSFIGLEKLYHHTLIEKMLRRETEGDFLVADEVEWRKSGEEAPATVTFNEIYQDARALPVNWAKVALVSASDGFMPSAFAIRKSAIREALASMADFKSFFAHFPEIDAKKVYKLYPQLEEAFPELKDAHYSEQAFASLEVKEGEGFNHFKSIVHPFLAFSTWTGKGIYEQFDFSYGNLVLTLPLLSQSSPKLKAVKVLSQALESQRFSLYQQELALADNELISDYRRSQAQSFVDTHQPFPVKETEGLSTEKAQALLALKTSSPLPSLARKNTEASKKAENKAEPNCRGELAKQSNLHDKLYYPPSQLNSAFAPLNASKALAVQEALTEEVYDFFNLEVSAAYKEEKALQGKKLSNNALLTPTLHNPQPLLAKNAEQAEQVEKGYFRDHLAQARKFLINLPAKTERKAFFYSQENTENFELFEAVNGKELPEQEIEQSFDRESFEARNNRLPTPGEIGCTLSHQRIYQQILADDTINDQELVLIAEDDIALTPNWYQKVNQVMEGLMHKPEVGFCILSQVYVHHTERYSEEDYLKVDYIYTDEDKYFEVGRKANHSYQQAQVEAVPQTTKVVNPEVAFATVHQFKPCASSFYLVRKSILKANRAIIEGRAFWYADDFAFLIPNINDDYLSYSNPILAVQSPDLPSDIEVERGEAEVDMRAKAQKTLLTDETVPPHYFNGRLYVLQATKSLAELKEAFPGYQIIKKVDYGAMTEEEKGEHFDLQGFKATYGWEPDDAYISDLLTFQSFAKTVMYNNDNSLQTILVAFDYVDFNDISRDFNYLITYINTRLTLNTCRMHLCAPSYYKERMNVEQLRNRGLALEGRDDIKRVREDLDLVYNSFADYLDFSALVILKFSLSERIVQSPLCADWSDQSKFFKNTVFSASCNPPLAYQNINRSQYRLMCQRNAGVKDDLSRAQAHAQLQVEKHKELGDAPLSQNEKVRYA